MFAKVPVLDPSTPEEGFAMMKAAFELSERYHTPVIVRPTTRICHASTYFEIEETTTARALPGGGFQRDSKYVIFPARSYEAHGEIFERLQDIAADYAHDPGLAGFNCGFEGPEGAFEPCLGIVAGGVSAAYVREALMLLQQQAQAQYDSIPDYRFMQIGTPYPFPADAIEEFVKGVDEILVFEELDHVLEDELLAYCGQTRGSYTVRGKLTGDASFRGENTVEEIMMRLAAFFGLKGVVGELPITASPALQEVLPTRPPVLCSGCPHRGSFYAVKKALKHEPAVFCGDIGCYTLGNAAPLDAVDTCLCMGAGITMAQGFATVEPDKKCIAFVGDSTFFASAMTGIANAVYNDHDITVVVLDNATTAMTGAQPHPGTGITLMGNKHEGISIRGVLEALGLKCIVTANPLDMSAAIQAAQQAIQFSGPSAIIFESPCVQLIKPAAPAVVNTAECTGCKRCITEIGCPAVGFDINTNGYRSDNRGTAFVDASLCNGCGLCTQLCPTHALALTANAQGGGAVC